MRWFSCWLLRRKGDLFRSCPTLMVCLPWAVLCGWTQRPLAIFTFFYVLFFYYYFFHIRYFSRGLLVPFALARAHSKPSRSFIPDLYRVDRVLQTAQQIVHCNIQLPWRRMKGSFSLWSPFQRFFMCSFLFFHSRLDDLWESLRRQLDGVAK